jgi:hypothetical protein
MKVFGDVFDYKLNWFDHILYAKNQAYRALHALKAKFFTTKELTLISSNL